MNSIKAAGFAAALTLLVSIGGCASQNVARPMTVTCGMPRQQLVDRVSALFASNGYRVTYASADAGTVQAEATDGAGMGYSSRRRMWSVVSSGNDMVVNASVLSKATPSSSEEVRTVDESSMIAGDAAWFQPVMGGLRGICSNPGSG